VKAPAPPAAPPAPPAKPEEEKPSDEVKDGMRLRGGLSLNGGLMLLPNTPNPGPAGAFAVRIGIQFNHYLGLVYQNTPMVTGVYQQSGTGFNMSLGVKVGAVDYNSVLLMLTLFHHLDIGAGPSLDFLKVANGSISLMGPMAGTSSGVSPGGHGRVAFNIGGLSGNGPRRSGLAIGVDAHPMFTPAGWAGSVTAGIGVEWY
jgi:hypothetical protein